MTFQRLFPQSGTDSAQACRVHITVAICTWNRCELLRATLLQMTKLVVPPNMAWEILIVDNNCTDDTAAVVATFEAALPIRAVHETAPGLSHSRNRALRESSADLVIFTDDDVLVPESWLAEFARAAEQFPEAAAFGGPITPWFLTPPDPDLCEAFPSLAAGFCGLDPSLPAGPLPPGAPIHGANMGYRRTAVAGMAFDPALGPSPSTPAGGDEVAFVRQLRARGGIVIWWPPMSVRHCVAPVRATRPYLEQFTRGKGREYVLDSISDQDLAVPQLFGAPRWLWRAWASAAARSTASACGIRMPFGLRLRSGPVPAGCSAAVNRLVWRRERLFLAGMLKGFRESRRATLHPAPTRILFLSDTCPWPLDNGYRQRIYHLLQALSRTHRVTLATVTPETLRGRPLPPADRCAEVIPLSDADCVFRRTGDFERWAPASRRLWTFLTSPYPNLVQRYRSQEILRTLRDLRRRDAFDVVWAERPYIAELARKAGFPRIIVDCIDVETVSFARAINQNRWYLSKPLHLLELAKLYAYDQVIPLRFWRVIVVKEEDRRFHRLRRSRVVTVPNGVVHVPPCPDVPNGPTPQLLFVGALNYESNIEAIRFFVERVLPLIKREHPGAHLVAIGRDPLPVVRELGERYACTVLSNVDDLKPHFDAASLFVAPIHLGGGTRLKVLEAMARRKAVVATSIGAEGLEIRRGIDLEIADTPEAFAAACGRLLRDPEARRQIADSARARVLARYHWDDISPIAARALDETVHFRWGSTRGSMDPLPAIEQGGTKALEES